MATTIDYNTQVISIPQADLTFIGGTLYALDTEAWRLEISALQATEEGMSFVDAIFHKTTTLIAGVLFARFMEIINGYTVVFEDGQYAVRLDGSNNNIFDEGIIVRNQVSIIPTNSAGLVKVPTPFASDEVFLGVAYDEDTPQVKAQFWLERSGVVVNPPISGSIIWYNEDGSVLFSATDMTPDPQGHFNAVSGTTLLPDQAYYAVVSVTDAAGTVESDRAVPTAA